MGYWESNAFRVMGTPTEPLTLACEETYPSYGEVVSRLRKLDNDPRGIAKVFDIGTTGDNVPPATRVIRAIKISSNAASDGDKSKPDILIVGGHHAREWISIVVPLCIAENLVSNYDHPEIKPLVDSHEIWIVPLLNPDGYEYSREEEDYSGKCEPNSSHPRCWRKNRRDLVLTPIGVNLNRNYDYIWNACDLLRPLEIPGICPENNRSSDEYKGESPFSEFETKAIKKFVEDRKDEGNPIQRLLSYHSFGQDIIYPSMVINDINDIPIVKKFTDIANKMNVRTGNVYDCVGSDSRSLFLCN